MTTTSQPGPQPNGPGQCYWVWNGVRWAPDPERPSTCVLGYACESQDGTPDGTYVGEPRATDCVPAP